MLPEKNFYKNYFFFINEEDGGPPLTTKEARTATLLHELPFLVPFQERVMLFQTKILKDKMEHQGEGSHFLQGPSIQISVRRNYLYEDAFDKLSLENGWFHCCAVSFICAPRYM